MPNDSKVKRTKRVEAQFTPNEYERAKKLADQNGLPIAVLLRHLALKESSRVDSGGVPL